MTWGTYLEFKSDDEEFEQEKKGLHNCTVRKTPEDGRKKTLGWFKNQDLSKCNLDITITNNQTGEEFTRRVKYISFHPNLDVWKISWYGSEEQ
jgi:hypothetical protein